MEDDVDTVQGTLPGAAVADVTLDKLGGSWRPGRLAEAVGLRLQVVEDSDLPAGSECRVNDVRADETGAAGDECETRVME
jgi:hypothetical protein